MEKFCDPLVLTLFAIPLMLEIQEEILSLLEHRPSEIFSLLWEMLFSIRSCLEPPSMYALSPLDNYGRERIVNKYIMN